MKRAIDRGLAAAAKADGFKKSGNNWTRAIDSGVTQAANVQGSDSNTTDHAKFTLNLGVYLPELAHILGQTPIDSPREVNCHLRCRVSRLMGVGDRWWFATSEREADEAGDELLLAWTAHALGWLEEVSTPTGALGWLRRTDFAFHGPVFGAALALLVGDEQQAKEIVEQNKDRMKASSRAWAREHGVMWSTDHDLL